MFRERIDRYAMNIYIYFYRIEVLNEFYIANDVDYRNVPCMSLQMGKHRANGLPQLSMSLFLFCYLKLSTWKLKYFNYQKKKINYPIPTQTFWTRIENQNKCCWIKLSNSYSKIFYRNWKSKQVLLDQILNNMRLGWFFSKKIKDEFMLYLLSSIFFY